MLDTLERVLRVRENDDDNCVDVQTRANLKQTVRVKRVSKPVAVMSATSLTYHQAAKHTIHLTTFSKSAPCAQCMRVCRFLLLFSLFSISFSCMHVPYVPSMRTRVSSLDADDER